MPTELDLRIQQHRDAVDAAIESGSAALAELRRCQPEQADKAAYIAWNDKNERVRRGIRRMQAYAAEWIR